MIAIKTVWVKLFRIIPFFRGGKGKGTALFMVLSYLIQMQLQKTFTFLCSCRLGISDLLGCLGQFNGSLFEFLEVIFMLKLVPTHLLSFLASAQLDSLVFLFVDGISEKIEQMSWH